MYFSVKQKSWKEHEFGIAHKFLILRGSYITESFKSCPCYAIYHLGFMKKLIWISQHLFSLLIPIYSNSRLSNIFNDIWINFHLQLILVIKRMISLQSMHHILMNDAELLKCLLIHLNFPTLSLIILYNNNFSF